MPTQVITGAARIVWGNPLESKIKMGDDKRPILDEQGKPIPQWSFGIAIPKAEFGHIWQALQAEALTAFPNGAPQNFAWKFKDGDGLDDQGKPFNTREGYAGCYVLSVVTEAFAPRVVRFNNGAYDAITEGVKTGDYVRVAINAKVHTGKPGTRGSKPGLYINPVMVEFLGYGQPIISGPDAMTVFGGQAVALPPGASAVPVAPVGGMPMPGQTPGQAAFPTQPGQYQPAPAPMPAQGPQNAPGAVPYAAPPAGYQQAPGAPGATAYPGNPGPAPMPAPHPGFVQQVAPGVMPQAPAPMPGQQFQPARL